MEVFYKPSFDTQRDKYSFCFTCDDCAHFDDSQDECLHGYPNQFHKLDYYKKDAKPGSILFCKDFDLA